MACVVAKRAATGQHALTSSCPCRVLKPASFCAGGWCPAHRGPEPSLVALDNFGLLVKCPLPRAGLQKPFAPRALHQRRTRLRAPRGGHALSSAVSLTAHVPHASCTQYGGGIYSVGSGDVVLSGGSAISGCWAVRLAPPQTCLAQQNVLASRALHQRHTRFTRLEGTRPRPAASPIAPCAPRLMRTERARHRRYASRRWHLCGEGGRSFADRALDHLQLFSYCERQHHMALQLGPAIIASAPHRPCSPRKGWALSSAASLTACVPHASCSQWGGGIYSREGGNVTLSEDSTISECDAVVSSSTATGRLPLPESLGRESVASAPRSVSTASRARAHLGCVTHRSCAPRVNPRARSACLPRSRRMCPPLRARSTAAASITPAAPWASIFQPAA